MNQPLSPEAQKLADEINKAFANVTQAFKALAQPRYTMDEIEAAVDQAADEQCYYDFSRSKLLKDVREGLERARSQASKA